MKNYNIFSTQAQKRLIISAISVWMIFFPNKSISAQEKSPFERFASEVDKILKASGNPGLEKMELDKKIRVLSLFLSSQQNFASSDPKSLDDFNAIKEEFKDSIQFMGLLADYNNADENMKRSWENAEEIMNDSHETEIKALTGLEQSQIPDMLEKTNAVVPNKKRIPPIEIKVDPIKKRTYTTADQDITAKLKGVTEKFLTAMKAKQFDTAMEYMSDLPKERFQSMLSKQTQDEIDRTIPNSWEFLRAQSDKQKEVFRTLVKLNFSRDMEFVWMVWRLADGKWKMFNSDTVQPEEIGSIEVKPEETKPVRDAAEKIMNSLSNFDINILLAMTSGKARSEIVKFLGNEEDMNEVRDRFQGLRWEIRDVTMGSNNNTAQVKVDFTTRSGEKDSWTITFEKVGNVWKMTDSE
ncbi:hypothetical protein ACFLT9_03520 [Acidobacteriota bacterium]